MAQGCFGLATPEGRRCVTTVVLQRISANMLSPGNASCSQCKATDEFRVQGLGLSSQYQHQMASASRRHLRVTNTTRSVDSHTAYWNAQISGTECSTGSWTSPGSRNDCRMMTACSVQALSEGFGEAYMRQNGCAATDGASVPGGTLSSGANAGCERGEGA